MYGHPPNDSSKTSLADTTNQRLDSLPSVQEDAHAAAEYAIPTTTVHTPIQGRTKVAQDIDCFGVIQ